MTFFLLRLKSYPIYEQLLLEEKLLRSGKDNWCLINEGSSPAIVMGISGKKEELVDCQKAVKDKIPLIKRFSGGGTVVVDEDTLFITFICQKTLHSFPSYPEPIMRWAETLYKEAFDHPEFSLKENDYVLGNKKCGGNAQYIRKERWLHHTSFLWDYSEERMQTLLHPKKTPSYRAMRPHTEFLHRLKDSFPCKNTCIENCIRALRNRFQVHPVSLKETLGLYPPLERQSTCLLDFFLELQE